IGVGTLNSGRDSNNTSTAGVVTAGPVGTGVLTIGTGTNSGAYEPTLLAAGGPRNIGNSILVNSNFAIAGANQLTLSGPMDLSAGPRVVTVASGSSGNLTGAVSGAAGSALIKEGAGPLFISGSLGYSGPTVVTEGMLTLKTTQRLNGQLAVAGGATTVVDTGANKTLVMPSVSVETVTGSKIELN